MVISDVRDLRIKSKLKNRVRWVKSPFPGGVVSVAGPRLSEKSTLDNFVEHEKRSFKVMK
jgi:hypothetical protein